MFKLWYRMTIFFVLVITIFQNLSNVSPSRFYVELLKVHKSVWNSLLILFEFDKFVSLVYNTKILWILEMAFENSVMKTIYWFSWFSFVFVEILSIKCKFMARFMVYDNIIRHALNASLSCVTKVGKVLTFEFEITSIHLVFLTAEYSLVQYRV